MANNNNGGLGWLVAGILGVGGYVAYKATQTSIHEYFLEFDELIDINQAKVENLESAQKAIQNKLTEHFKFKRGVSIPDFVIQGSYVTKTLVQNAYNKCDVDIAVIFKGKPDISVNEIKRELQAAVNDHTRPGATITPTCVRLDYVRDFHLDLPIYFKEGRKMYFLSQKYGTKESNPQKFVDWFQNQTEDYPQLIRMIRYLKAWTDFIKINYGKEMPSGLVFTIWAVKFYEEYSKDEEAFAALTERILKYLDRTDVDNWVAKMPVPPKDNVLDRLNINQREFFFEKFKLMNTIAQEAIDSKKEVAIEKWQKVFGERFASTN